MTPIITLASTIQEKKIKQEMKIKQKRSRTTNQGQATENKEEQYYPGNSR